MDNINRRAALKILSAAPVAAGFALTEAEAQQAHHQAQQAKQAAQKTGKPFAPKFFTAHEYQTVRVLSDLIIPADDRSGSATAAGVPEFMDFTMIDQPARQVAMRGGLAWLDQECQRRFDRTFVGATDQQRTEVLDAISTYGEIDRSLTHGHAFFRNFRDLTATGFWTSKMGFADLGYIGNTMVAKWEGCPPEQLKKLGLATIILALCAGTGVVAQQTAPQTLQRPPEAHRALSDPSAYVPDMKNLAAATSELRDVVERFAADGQAIQRFYSVPGSTERRAKLRGYYDAWLAALPKIDFARLSREGQVDYVLLRNHIEYQLALLRREERYQKQTAPLVPFAEDIIKLQEARQKLEFISPDAAAAALPPITEKVRQAAASSAVATATPLAAMRASQTIERLRGTLDQWFNFYNGYDPGFTAKVPEHHRALVQQLTDYGSALRTRAGLTKTTSASDDIVGDPIGREGLLEDLAGELIPYTPEELLEVGNREYAWCEAEMKRASREMGFGDDWMKALDKVKNAYVPRGEQPQLIRDLALEAEAYLQKHNLVTVPPLAADIWRMGMMSLERQRVNPFFTGGETISVSYPTNTMSAEDGLMSMRGNGIHVSRATVQHELIPGHHLKGFLSQRYNSHRSLFGTPFMGEGWALYWELLLWDHGFPRSPEDRIGMLWWRMHRAVRIIFSLNFHLGRWTPEQCIDFVVNRGGHERFTATGEVRRSFAGNYSPLYQAAYMLGGLQIRSLYKELVDKKKMTAVQFNDAILKAGSMPIEMLRAVLTPQPLARDYRAQWKFYGDVPAASAAAQPIAR